ncbi:Nif3-like dinuclear metal center hexameric protein [Buchnera aphidicola]|uniref:Nif3-like dinuclear metal center hexameric protein n=1 Tax=Buchnera aphidicola TaxID=9 RepID=UPI00094C11D3|nr:Nif3-like dinuclear metal center hexameric protein [Buchnera aphidicola]
MNNFFLEKLINKKLRAPKYIDDYMPNGLQVEGKSEIKNIITGVTASQKLLDIAINTHADAVIVHHGYFWKNQGRKILGMNKSRLQKLLTHNINLYAWHLPLDTHPELGNNAQLGKLLNISTQGIISPYIFMGYFKKKHTKKSLSQLIKEKLNRDPFHYGQTGTKYIRNIAWCTGKGQKLFPRVVNLNLDAYLTGEVSEDTVHIAEENNMHFFSLGHHATEKFGIQALGKWLFRKDKNLKIKFIDIENPI